RRLMYLAVRLFGKGKYSDTQQGTCC
ncbi:phage tail protein, partial [Escherichia coli]|nr:phage tail protein [Escherichia coli]EFC2029393.1 phage tail protein [Escherichia coli]EFN9110047.1 phage tail protein [Escherichia coli]EFN9130538.1 phage tail protein [Escherichia coli]EFO1422616.1 phage tail protein [Escherichia coli]